MLRLTNVPIMIVLAVATCFPQSVKEREGEQAPWPPLEGTVNFFVDLVGPIASTLDEDIEYLCRSSKLIVYATVETLSTRTAPRHLETDAVLRIEDVLKGRPDFPRIVVSERGGTLGSYREVPQQYSMMQSGERYILFLRDDIRRGLPVQPDIPRYGLTRSFHGKFLVDGTQRVHVGKGAPDALRERFDGASVEQLLTEIRYWTLRDPTDK